MIVFEIENCWVKDLPDLQVHFFFKLTQPFRFIFLALYPHGLTANLEAFLQRRVQHHDELLAQHALRQQLDVLAFLAQHFVRPGQDVNEQRLWWTAATGR